MSESPLGSGEGKDVGWFMRHGLRSSVWPYPDFLDTELTEEGVSLRGGATQLMVSL